MAFEVKQLITKPNASIIYKESEKVQSLANVLTSYYKTEAKDHIKDGNTNSEQRTWIRSSLIRLIRKDDAKKYPVYKTECL